MKKQKPVTPSLIRRLLLPLLLLAMLLSAAGCQTPDPGNGSAQESHTEAQNLQPSEELSVTFLDVGQGNCILIRSGTHTMLFDGGDPEHSSYVVSYLKKQGVETIDLMIASHYDADHISGLIGVLNVFEVKEVMAPDYEHDTKTYRSFLSILEEKNLTPVHPLAGESYSFGEGEFTIVCPSRYQPEESNNNSIGIRLCHGSNSFLILGDAEEPSEQDMLESGAVLDSDVYLASHHGSSTASSASFLEEVTPDTVVISSGAGNRYGHPHAQALHRLETYQPDLFRTDLQGTLTAVSDGNKVTWSQEPCNDWTPGNTEQDTPPEDPAYIGNKNSLKFHLPDCSGLPAEKNRIYFRDREEAVELGYEPCGLCHP